MATRVNGTTETISSKYKVTPYYYYTVSETATTYSLTLYGGIAINNVYFEDWQLALQITGTGKTTQSKRLLIAETGPKDVQFISAFTWSWNKTKATQSITINAIHGTWNDEGVISPKPAYAAKKTFTIPTKTTYLIKYDANGGTGAPAQQTKWHGENITLQAGIPTRANYTFMGWATSQSGSVAYQPSATYTANADVTLYAVWKPFEYAVTYNANGGTGAPAQQTKYYGADLTLSAVIPIRAGYTFLGWATSQGGAVAYQPSAIYTANSPITLYAVWEAYYTYTINTMRVNASGDIIEDPNGEWIYIKANLTTEEYTNNPLKAYHFKDNGATKTVGWYKNSNKTNSVSFPYQPTANSFILYAWYHADTEKHELSFQFDTNHTTGKVISVIVPPIFRTMDFLAGGKGVAIGKRATKTGMEIAMPVTIEDKPLTVINNTFYQKNTTVDLKEANNNVSANTYLAFVYRDKNNKEQGRFGFGTFPDGRTRTEMTVRNYDANGNQVANKGFSISMDKTGNVTYGVTQPEQLRAALGLQDLVAPKEYNWDQFIYSSGFTYYTNDEGGANTPKAYKAGRYVSLFGAYRTTAAQTSTGEKLMGYVPAGCEPIHTINSVQQGSGQARYLLSIYPNGQMYASRYGTTSDTAIINLAWLNIFVSYISKA